MSILGKLLIVFNLLAAGAFAWFTLENWKLRQDLTFAALEREVKLRGLPVDAGEPPADLDKDRVVFKIETSPGGSILETLSKKDAAKLLPAGDSVYGNNEGDLIADQSAEVKRAQKKVLATVPAAGDQTRNAWLQTYLLNLSRTGAERDGVNGLFDLLVEAKAAQARRDLPLLGRTASQVAALRTAVAITDLGDPQAIMPENVKATRVGAAREAVRQFLLGEVPQGVPAGGGAQDEPTNKLRNAILDVLDRKGAKEAVVSAATSDPTGFGFLADVAVEPLTDKPSVDRAIKALIAYTDSKGSTPTEKAAMNGLATLINPPPVGANISGTVDQVAIDLLNSKFDEAALPAGAKFNNAVGEKARKIAHVLYHLDAHRHAVKDQPTVDARKAWHARVASVVGLQEYVRAAEAQASEFNEASQRLLSVITEEQSAFEAEYQAKTQQVQYLYSQWNNLEGAYRVQNDITKENERLRAERETERDKLKNELTAAQAAAKDALERLRKSQGQLFAIQRQLRDAQAALMNLEGELRKLELADKR
jgi:hypothetical protein